MRLNRTFLALTLAAALLPLGVNAQQRTRVLTIAKHGWLGFSYDFTSISRDGRVTATLTVDDVVKDSPAERAGIKPGDQVLRIDGKPIAETQFMSLAGRIQPGDTVRLRVSSNGSERDVTLVATDQLPGMMSITLNGDSIRTNMRIYLDSVRAGMFKFDTLFARDSMFYGRMPGFPDIRVFSRIRDGAFPFDTMFFNKTDGFRIFADSLPGVFKWRHNDFPSAQWEPWDLPRLEMMSDRGVAGAEFVPITAGLGEVLGTTNGILVARVGPETPAARAGLQDGDVVTRVNGKAVSDVSELRRAVQRTGNEVVKLEVMRKGKTRSLELQARTRR
jgi:predicted metalloprotease with PDZ domain